MLYQIKIQDNIAPNTNRTCKHNDDMKYGSAEGSLGK